MARNEKSSKELASLASRALRQPNTLNAREIKSLAASVLTQAPDKKGTNGKKSKG